MCLQVHQSTCVTPAENVCLQEKFQKRTEKGNFSENIQETINIKLLYCVQKTSSGSVLVSHSFHVLIAVYFQQVTAISLKSFPSYLSLLGMISKHKGKTSLCVEHISTTRQFSTASQQVQGHTG